ncbi:MULTISPECIES: LysR family transcriptional regulator [unclassified Beijerinckia]|uniref:LysR family transcriptional regulator n=1 Tax=unclassified Beijerinckia TaxID=2638183 RepID=UPI00089B99B3|nr:MULTISPECIES: LysR family transcriptional regulator [unclassified Beijerinckia]MDH7799460.1 DNA-binding transcriptional LysR family regulator [Beijerinckia sp. GAS462]SED51224.1 transcriptional regulator, LysR family [Beijerinckia sp. 28-YEA-48]
MAGQAPNWRNLDLNLLVVFQAVMETKSATAAAGKLNISQPAVSHALTRLRGSLNDELFVRTPGGLEPTPFALNLSKGVRTALDELQVALDGAAEFVPATAEREFTIALNNHAALVLAAPLAAAIAKEAPGIVLNLRPSGTLDIAEALDRGDIDGTISQLAAPAERFADVKLFDETFAAIVRADHPSIGQADQISLEALSALPHLLVTSTGENTDFVDKALRERGLSRKIVLRAPLLATESILLRSDMVAIVGRRAAQAFALNASLRVLDLPFETPSFPIALLWHRRFDHLPAHQWLRGLIIGVAKLARR